MDSTITLLNHNKIFHTQLTHNLETDDEIIFEAITMYYSYYFTLNPQQQDTFKDINYHFANDKLSDLLPDLYLFYLEYYSFIESHIEDIPKILIFIQTHIDDIRFNDFITEIFSDILLKQNPDDDV